MIILPINAFSAAACCGDSIMEIQHEKTPCHEDPGPENEQKQPCSMECILCMAGILFLAETAERHLYANSTEIAANILFFNNYDLKPPFKPPKVS
jgi:hypothetical protein